MTTRIFFAVSSHLSSPTPPHPHHHIAPEITATETSINSLKLNGMESISVDADIGLQIVNTNKNYPIAFDPVELTFYFPASPDVPVGHGVLEGGVIPAGATTTRNLHTVFDAPWSVLGMFGWRGGREGGRMVIVVAVREAAGMHIHTQSSHYV